MKKLEYPGDQQAATNLAAVHAYWNAHIHDLAIAKHAIGSPEFFQELDEYRFDKLRYLPDLVDFSAYKGKRLLEVGCGVGIDLVRFSRAGAKVTGVDLSEVAVELARKNVAQHGLNADLRVMNGEELALEDDSFDVVYAHGVLQYTPNPRKMVAEIHRVLRPGGRAIMMVYNRYSWLKAMSILTRVELEHQDAPVIGTFSRSEFRKLLESFKSVRIVPERFPVKSRLHQGLKATVYNGLFVTAFQLLPRRITRSTGWHLIGFATK